MLIWKEKTHIYQKQKVERSKILLFLLHDHTKLVLFSVRYVTFLSKKLFENQINEFEMKKTDE